MNHRIKYAEWTRAQNTIQGQTINQYIASINKLSTIVNIDIFTNTDVNLLEKLYSDLIANQKNTDSIYFDIETPSYALKGWYSASLRTYIDYLKSPNGFNIQNKEKSNNTIINELAQAVCVTGESGVGKTFTVTKILTEENHNILYLIIDNMWQHLLFDYSPEKRAYSLTKVGAFIKNASENLEKKHTIIIDECHKNLEIINDSLLQAISTNRNDGKRFLILNSLVENEFDFLVEDSGKKLLPDNIGFIFISSKTELILGNDDLKNRVKIIELKIENRDFMNRSGFKLENLLSLIKEGTESGDFSI